MAATVSTEISPMVSHARMSTRITFTTFSPWPSSYAMDGMSREIRSAVREEIEKAASAIMKMPKTTAKTARKTRCPALRRFHSGPGSERSASTKATREIVSTSIWVRARSGAPCSAKSRASP